MTKKILFGILILVLLINGCSQEDVDIGIPTSICKSPYIEYKAGECCVDTNSNSICDNDEKKEESKLTEESKESGNEDIDLEFDVIGLDVDYIRKLRETRVLGISYKIKNKGDSLEDLELKVEVYQDDKLIGYSNQINVDKLKINENKIDYKYLGISAIVKVTSYGKHNLDIKTSLYNKNRLIKEQTYALEIIEYKRNVGENIITITHNVPSFDYEIIPQRISSDGNIDFMIFSSSEDILYYKIKNVGNETVSRNFILDYYCENTVNKKIGNYYVDIISYSNDLVGYKIRETKYNALPLDLPPNFEIKSTIWKNPDCDKNILILRYLTDNGYDFYVRAY